MNSITIKATEQKVNGKTINLINFETIGSPTPEAVAEAFSSIQGVLESRTPILINSNPEATWMTPLIVAAAKAATIAVKHTIRGYVVVQSSSPHLPVGLHLSNENSLALL